MVRLYTFKILSILIILSIFSFERAFAIEGQRLVNKIVAVIGDEILTLYELEEMAQPFYQTYIPKGISQADQEKLKERIRKEILDQWIEDTLIGLEAKKYGINVSDEELEEFLKMEAKRQDHLTLSGEEREKLRERLKKIKFVQILVRDKIAIPDEEIKKAYQERIKNHVGVPRYHLEVLLFRRDIPVEELYNALLRGKTFEEIAREKPADVIYFREIFKEEELDQEILAKIRDLRVGEVSTPIFRGETVQIIRVLRRESPTPPSLEELRKELYEELFQKRAQEYLEKWIRELRENRLIKIYL